MSGGFEPDDGAKASAVLMREMKNNAAPDRAAHHDRVVEFQGIGDLQDHLHVVARGEAIFLVLPAGRR
jgi:hypothetical protein